MYYGVYLSTAHARIYKENFVIVLHSIMGMLMLMKMNSTFYLFFNPFPNDSSSFSNSSNLMHIPPERGNSIPMHTNLSSTSEAPIVQA